MVGVLPVGLAGLVGIGFVDLVLLLHVVAVYAVDMCVVVKPTDIVKGRYRYSSNDDADDNPDPKAR